MEPSVGSIVYEHVQCHTIQLRGKCLTAHAPNNLVCRSRVFTEGLKNSRHKINYRNPHK